MRLLSLMFMACVSFAQNTDEERARQLLTSGHPAEAAAIYQDLARANPANANLLLNLSIAEYKAGHFRESAESATAALKLNPNLAPASLFLGASLLELGEFTQSGESLERAVAADPKDRNARLMLGEALLRAGRAAAALEHLQAAADMLRANPRVWYALGRAYEALGRKEAAADAWRTLLALPSSFESHVHAAEVNDAEHRWREAAGEWRQASEFAPHSRTARIGLAWSEFRSRNYDAAMAVLKPLLKSDDTATVQFLYGASLLNLQQPAEAMPYLRAALAHDPGLLSASAALGQALLQTGQPDEAIPLLKRALAVDQDGSTHFQLFRACQLAGRNADARQALAGYQRLRRSGAAVP
jgi:tetratricopeptide (TPR) repeat protein